MANIVAMTISDYDLDGITSISDFYDDLADNFLGVRGKRRYNPRYIYVAENIYTQFADMYAKQGADKVEFVMAWVNIGAKVDETLEDNQIRIEDGFVERVE